MMRSEILFIYYILRSESRRHFKELIQKMELMTWLWAYDKQLMAVCCTVRHSYNSFVYLWLLPIILSAMALVLAYASKMMDTRDLR